MPLPTSPTFSLNFSYPAQADTTPGLTLAAYSYTGAGRVIAINGYGGYPGSYGAYSSPITPATSPVPVNYNLASLYLGGYTLDSLLSPNGANCQSFRPPQDAALGSVTVTPADVKTCYVYFVAYTDSNRNGLPESSEVRYMTHDVLSYADKTVTLSFLTAAPNMKQTWNFAAGWSRAAHYVYLPDDSATYLRSLNSDPVQRYELHEPTPFTSQ